MFDSEKISSLHLIGSKGSGGAERFFVRLVNAMSEEGQTVSAAMPGNSVLVPELSKQVPFYASPMRNVFDPFSRLSLSRIIKKVSPDIVQTYMGRATRLVHLDKNKGPVHVTRLGSYYNLKGYRHAHAWVGNTRGICDYLIKEGLPSERVFHISNFIDLPQRLADSDKQVFKQQNNIPQDAWLIAAVGRLHPNKGFADLLKALALLKKTFKDRPVYLALAGDGPLREELHELADQLGLADQVCWLGWLSPPDILYQSADAFVCPSVHEPLGNVILEGWSQQVPVISTETYGALELITDGENGLLVPVSDAGALAAGIRELIEASGEQRLALVKNGLETLQQSYSRQVILGQYADLYQSLRR